MPRRFVLRRLRQIDYLGEIFARLRALAHEIQHDARRIICRLRIRCVLKSLSVQCQSFCQFSLAHQCLAPLHKFGLFLPAGRLCKESGRGYQKNYQDPAKHSSCIHRGDYFTTLFPI